MDPVVRPVDCPAANDDDEDDSVPRRDDIVLGLVSTVDGRTGVILSSGDSEKGGVVGRRLWLLFDESSDAWSS
jgi:hypothetical protein